MSRFRNGFRTCIQKSAWLLAALAILWPLNCSYGQLSITTGIDTTLPSGTGLAGNDAPNGNATEWEWDGSDGGGFNQGLIWFDISQDLLNGFVTGGANASSATLRFPITNDGSSGNMHRITVDWLSITDGGNDITYNNFPGGPGIVEGVNATQNPSVMTGDVTGGTVHEIDVTADVAAWAQGEPNFGWGILPTGTNGAGVASFETATPPELVLSNLFLQDADFNSDGSIDLVDFNILADNFLTGTTFEQGDMTLDGAVNLSDFVAFRQVFNGQGGAAAVPEPSSLLLLLLALPFFFGRRLWRGRKTANVAAVLAVLAICTAGFSSVTLAQITDISWNVPGPDDWQSDANWVVGGNPSPVPDATFFEGAVIGNGGTAFLEGAPPDILRLNVDSGRLEIRNGGVLNVITDPLEAASGDGRTQADGTISLQGNGMLDIGRNFANAGVIDLASATAAFNVGGDFSQAAGGTLQVAVNGSNASIDVGGTATLGGTVIIDPASPVSFGDSFDVVTASQVQGGFGSVQLAAGNAPLGRGLTLAGVVANGTASVTVENRPVLVVNRATGKTDLTNPAGGPLTLTGYSIASSNGLLGPGGWQSIASGNADWTEANPLATGISELNLTGEATIALDGSLDLGNAYNGGNTHPSNEDVTLTYSTPEGRVISGLVEYTGPANDLVLNIDPTTGEAAISNLSTFTDPIDVSGYSILSASGSLLPASWNSFSDSGEGGEGWVEANPTNNALSELNLENSQLFSNGTLIPLGQIVNADPTRDVVFQFAVADTPEVRFGTVTYGPFEAAPPGLAADFNKDGNVNLEDFNILKGNFGSSGATMAEGDANMDGNVNLEDFNILKGQFGQSGAAVPEPSTWLLAALGCLLMFMRKRA